MIDPQGTQRLLFHGDNLNILREHVPDNSMGLIYLDPPFNSKRDRNVIFREEEGAASPAHIKVFADIRRRGVPASPGMTRGNLSAMASKRSRFLVPHPGRFVRSRCVYAS